MISAHMGKKRTMSKYIIFTHSYVLIRKGLTMTVRELINALLTFDADETIYFYLCDKDIIIKEFGHWSDLPYIEFKEDNME